MIILIGYMGAGKSTIGEYLNFQHGLSYCDLDDYIEKNEKMSILEIFEKKGEIYFRKIEHEQLKEVLRQKNVDILSLGGGTPCYAGNMELINDKNIESYYLKPDLDTLTERLFSQKDKRPLINDIKTKDALKDFIRKHIFEREFYYRQAKHTLNLSNLSVKEVSEKILNNLE